jgi:hypothetical protein
MLESEMLKTLQWEPCILKHAKNYENPWQGDRAIFDNTWGLTALACRCTNIQTGKSIDYPSMKKCALAIEYTCDYVRKSIYINRIIGGKYKVVLLDKAGNVTVKSS